jgi:hypothetical protein
VNLVEANKKVNDLVRAWILNPTDQTKFELKLAADARDKLYFATKSQKEMRRWNRS